MAERWSQRYFTQIGTSFYRSPDFRGEQAEMRSWGLIATPISAFGIGVLSCFMIADRVSVRTNPGQLSDTRQALDLEISGPGSLFWTRRGTRVR
jgi:molecular chaperone HtpG